MRTVTTLALRRRLTTSSGARTTTNHLKLHHAEMSHAVVPQPCPTPIFLPTVRRTAEAPTSVRTRRSAQLVRPEPLLLPERLPPLPLRKRLSPTCGTRTTSARSQP